MFGFPAIASRRCLPHLVIRGIEGKYMVLSKLKITDAHGRYLTGTTGLPNSARTREDPARRMERNVGGPLLGSRIKSASSPFGRLDCRKANVLINIFV